MLYRTRGEPETSLRHGAGPSAGGDASIPTLHREPFLSFLNLLGQVGGRETPVLKICRCKRESF